MTKKLLVPFFSSFVILYYNNFMTNLTDQARDQLFETLVYDIRGDLERGIDSARRAAHQARVITYWNIGRRISESFLDQEFRSSYGTSLYRKLETRLNFKERVLQHMVQFYRSYPDQPPQTELTWTHYRYLLNIPDEEQRRRAERDMIRLKITSGVVKNFISIRKSSGIRRVRFNGGQLTLRRGVPYLYTIRRGSDIHGEPFSSRLDLGFRMSIDSEQAGYIQFVKARLVRSHKTLVGYRLETYHGRNEELYTYGARIDRIVDGDTLVARVDLGFGLVTHQRLRLRGINAPENSSRPGQRAKVFLQEALERAEKIVVKTHHTPGKYGRYLADLFILPGCDDLVRIAAEGEHLNQSLLDEGLAEVYEK